VLAVLNAVEQTAARLAREFGDCFFFNSAGTVVEL
jgi:hypothetical protein